MRLAERQAARLRRHAHGYEQPDDANRAGDQKAVGATKAARVIGKRNVPAAAPMRLADIARPMPVARRSVGKTSFGYPMGVHDVWQPVAGECFFQRLHGIYRLQRNGHPLCKNLATRPIYSGERKRQVLLVDPAHQVLVNCPDSRKIARFQKKIAPRSHTTKFVERVNKIPAAQPHFICYECCVAPLLQQLVARRGVAATCSLCELAKTACISAEDDEFLLAVKALVRYHFGEWQYHSKLGEGTLESLFFIDPNPILKVHSNQDPVDREDVVMTLLDDVNNRQSQIELFTAYGRDIYNYTPKTPVSSGEILYGAGRALRERNHFLVEAEYVSVIRPAVPYISRTLAARTRWYRARLGASTRAANFREIGAPPSYFYQPHADKTLGAPPVGSTGAGRANRPGVSYLYLASDAETAAAEIRPHPGEMVSLGGFELTREQRVVDLRAHDLTKLWQSDQELEMLELVIAMEKAFATAAPPSNRSAYTVTQFLVELFRQLAFDGVLFRSTVGDGDNLVLFDPASATWLPGSSRVIDVTKVRYELVDRQLFDATAEYDVDYDQRQKIAESTR